MPDLPHIPIATAPYEGAIIAIVNLAMKAIEGQTPDQRARMWEIHIRNLENWISFWEKFGAIFQPKPPAPPAVK
jgi:hypothetical protein